MIQPFLGTNKTFIPTTQRKIAKKQIPQNTLSLDYIFEHDFHKHERVKKWIQYFTQKDRSRFQRFIDRGKPYKKMIESILQEEGLPTELYYLALIESGFYSSAKSHASAVGFWQFMSGTAKRFGLKVDRYTDERRDPIRSTLIAAKYLHKLYKVFNSWPLAVSAYNAGESRVMNGIIRHSERDYWKLCKMKGIPRETRNYLPKLMAAIIIGHDLEKFGFTVPSSEPHPELAAIWVPPAVSLLEVSRKANISYSTIQKYNAHLKRNITPPNRKKYRLWLPGNPNEKQLYQDLLGQSRHSLRQLVSKKSIHHKVRRGETLGLLARKYKTTITQIKRANHLRNNRIYRGQRLNIPGNNYIASMTKYKVKRGDNLFLVAKKFGTSISAIKKINNMRHSRIYAGQILTVKEFKR